MIHLRPVLLAAAFLLLPASLPAEQALLPGLEGWSHPISSKNELARRYFDQGLTLSYGFNHAGAEASFRKAARLDPACAQPGLGALQLYFSIPNFTAVRFGHWQEILAAQEPDADLPLPRAIHHFARGMALLRGGDLAAAEAENGKLAALALDPALEQISIWDINRADQLAHIAVQILSGEIALARGATDKALRHLEKAVALEDLLRYDEPPTWPLATRHFLGAALLANNQAGAAEVIYRQDLERQPENGWSLYGLAQSLKAQDQPKAAQEVEIRFARAFSGADVEIQASRF